MPSRIITANLTDEARRKLVLAVGHPKFSNSTLKPDQYCHHVTLAYQPTQGVEDKIRSSVEDGDEVAILCKRRCWSETFGVEAMEVVIKTTENDSVFVNNPVPHITLSTEGKPPKFSNDLFVRAPTLPDFHTEDFSFLELEAIVDFS